MTARWPIQHVVTVWRPTLKLMRETELAGFDVNGAKPTFNLPNRLSDLLSARDDVRKAAASSPPAAALGFEGLVPPVKNNRGHRE